MALIARDLMVGNPKLKALGFGEESQGHNAIASGFQGQRQWTDHLPNGDFLEAILNSSFDWTGIRAPYIGNENDAMNGASMLLGHLLTGRAQIRRCAHLLVTSRGQTCHRASIGRTGSQWHPAPDQLRSGDAGWHRAAEPQR
jgi:hypothetical protein